MRSERHKSGFTLMEMLLATAMVAMLAASLYGSLYVAFKARTSATKAVTAVRQRNLVFEIIRSDLQSAMIPTMTPTTGSGATGGSTGFGGTRSFLSSRTLGGGGGGAMTSTIVLAGPFIGRAPDSMMSAGLLAAAMASDPTSTGNETLSFYASLADLEPAVGTGDVKKITYTLEGGTAGAASSLIRRVTSNVISVDPAQPMEEVICRNVSAMSLRYFDGTTWADGWDSTQVNNTLPLAVELTIVFVGVGGGEPYTMIRTILISQGQNTTDAGTGDTATGTTVGAAP